MYAETPPFVEMSVLGILHQETNQESRICEARTYTTAPDRPGKCSKVE